jgi:ABC-type antimicrobial peptide transport system permease subunit
VSGAPVDQLGVCELPGCENPVERLSSGELRRFCCGTHRKKAREATYAARLAEAAATRPAAPNGSAPASRGTRARRKPQNPAGAAPPSGSGNGGDSTAQRAQVPRTDGRSLNGRDAPGAHDGTSPPASTHGTGTRSAGTPGSDTQPRPPAPPEPGTGPAPEQARPGTAAPSSRPEPDARTTRPAAAAPTARREADAPTARPSDDRPQAAASPARPSGDRPPARTVVPEARSRWFGRRKVPYAARGTRHRPLYSPDPAPSQPDWLLPPVSDREVRRAERAQAEAYATPPTPEPPPALPPTDTVAPAPDTAEAPHATDTPPAAGPPAPTGPASPTDAQPRPDTADQTASQPDNQATGAPATDQAGREPDDQPTEAATADRTTAEPDGRTAEEPADAATDAPPASEGPATDQATAEPGDQTSADPTSDAAATRHATGESAAPTLDAPAADQTGEAAEHPDAEQTATHQAEADRDHEGEQNAGTLTGSDAGGRDLDPATGGPDEPATAPIPLPPGAPHPVDTGEVTEPIPIVRERPRRPAFRPWRRRTRAADGQAAESPRRTRPVAGTRTMGQATAVGAATAEPGEDAATVSPGTAEAPGGSDPRGSATATTDPTATTEVASDETGPDATTPAPVRARPRDVPSAAALFETPRPKTARPKTPPAEQPGDRTQPPEIPPEPATSGVRRGPRFQASWPGELREALHAALHSLAANRLRSLLTTVGIIAGVASVIVLVAMGKGMEQGFNDQFSRFATQVTITPITGPVATGKAPQHLTDSDFRALHNRDLVPDVSELSAAVSSNAATLTVGQQKANSQLFGIQENYLELANRHTVAGRWFSAEEINNGVRQAVLGPQVVNSLWGPGTDPHTVVGQSIRVGHSTFEIQGVVNSDGQNDNVVMVPLSAARSFVVGNNAGKLDVIIAKSTGTSTLKQAESEIYGVLYTQHHVRVDTDRDFNVQDFTSILEQQMQSIKFLQMFIVAIAAISLFVGGVGVANIMLVSVTERTREIGIRKAIGAPRRAIMRQFLSEAVLLTALGGMVGVVLGIGLCMLGKVVIPKVWPPDPSSLTPTPLPILTLAPVLVAFGVSLVIGLLAGGYPAFRASRLRPIQALRFE